MKNLLCVLPESIGNNIFLIHGHFFDEECCFLADDTFALAATLLLAVVLPIGLLVL